MGTSRALLMDGYAHVSAGVFVLTAASERKQGASDQATVRHWRSHGKSHSVAVNYIDLCTLYSSP